MRPFVVSLPSGVRYWTVLDDDLAVVAEADAFLRHLRLGRDCSELTTRSYAGGVALFLGWCSSTGKHWHVGVEQLGLFITWPRHAHPQGADADGFGREATAVVLAGPGRRPVRGARRINAVLTAVRGFVVHAVTSGDAPGTLLSLIYELADDRDLPEQARGEDPAMAWRWRGGCAPGTGCTSLMRGWHEGRQGQGSAGWQEAEAETQAGSASGVAHDAAEHTTAELGELFGVARSTVYRTVKRARAPTSTGLPRPWRGVEVKAPALGLVTAALPTPQQSQAPMLLAPIRGVSTRPSPTGCWASSSELPDRDERRRVVRTLVQADASSDRADALRRTLLDYHG